MEIDSIYGYNFTIIDIRDSYSYNISHLDNSINISFYKLLANHKEILDKNKQYLLICETGVQSKMLMNTLNKMGYHTFSLKDGYRGLVKKGKIR